MSSQCSFASLEFQHKKKRTRREKFLTQMDRVLPWDLLEGLIAPHYHKAEKGRQPMPLSRMLRIYFLQQWYQLSDPAAEDALYDIASMRLFAGIDLGRDSVPDETTILRFRHLLEEHDLPKRMFDAVATDLEEAQLLLRGGTIMDATLIAAPTSTKNKKKERDPDMRSSKKGNKRRTTRPDEERETQKSGILA